MGCDNSQFTDHPIIYILHKIAIAIAIAIIAITLRMDAWPVANIVLSYRGNLELCRVSGHFYRAGNAVNS